MDLNKALKDFFIREPFYGTLMLNFNKKLVDDDHPVKTAAVAVEGLSLTLYINKSFWNTLSDVQCRMLLKHEAMHCAFFHLTSLYNVPNGKIRIGNQDINEIKLTELRNSVCYITQEHFLFSTTIKENIGLFRDCYTDEAIIESTKSAMIADDIERMENGINTVVGERGIDLSGGQKQRVVISRAFLQKSNIVIFDDTFSALDNKTEEFLLKNIRELTKGKTSFIIAHRLSTIKNADLLVEIISTAYLMMIQKIDEMGYLNDTLNDVNLEPGSISKIIYYFYSSCSVPLKYEAIDSLQKTIHQNIEAMLKGGDE